MTAPILDIAAPADRRIAAAAAANGAPLFYAFGNFCALAARSDLEAMWRVNRLKGRPLDQVGSVTTTPAKRSAVFDWSAVVEPPTAAIAAVMDELHALGPIGFRGPAAAWIPEHLTQVDAGVRTVQLISPGDACASNELIGEILELTGERILYITSANRSGDGSAAHYEMEEIRRDFGREHRVSLIGHRDEAAIRRGYPQHLPCSTSIVGFHRGALTLERLGSLAGSAIAAVASRHGLELAIEPGARERIAMRESPVLAHSL
jgi:tRNA A37 threonylcarbamoyladenosine synthetase subunit TsaC/SUA5/YrdC